MTAPGLRHKPIRRTWVCGTCGEPWLCGEAKAELLEIFDAASPVLRGLLNFFMVEAVMDFIAFRKPEPRVMADRIYGWYTEIVFMAIDGERSLPPPNDPHGNGATPQQGGGALDHRPVKEGRW